MQDSSSFNFDSNEINSQGINEITKLNSSGAICDAFKIRFDGKWYFMKRPKAEFATDTVYLTSFKKEFNIGHSLNHPGIVHYELLGEDEKGIFIISEWIQGSTLDVFVKENPLYFKKKANRDKFAKQLCDAITYLHQRQILHLDLKPGNIMITDIDHDVKLIDFGFAYNDSYQFTACGSTANYAAPEQLEKDGVITEKADIYAIGLVLQYAITARIDATGEKQLPLQWRTVIRHCKQHDPTMRPQSADDVAHALLHHSHWLLYSIIALAFIIISSIAITMSLKKDYFYDAGFYYMNMDKGDSTLGITYKTKKKGGLGHPIICNDYIGDIVIPDSAKYHGKLYPVTTIERGAFWGCDKITSVKIGDNIKYIDRLAFEDCNFATINFGKKLKQINAWSFENDSDLTSIVFPEGFKYIESSAFNNDVRISTVVLPKTLDGIENFVFSHCTDLKDIYCYVKKPFSIAANVFDSIEVSKCTLHVPTGSVDAYKAMPVWKDFIIKPLLPNDPKPLYYKGDDKRQR
jgi:hypothetical protein